VRTINYSFEIDGLKSNDVSIFSPHFFENMGIISWCYAQEPRSLIWAVRSDGKLLCFTWEQEQNVWGWTLCETDGSVLSICAISEEGEDRVYLIVEREVDGQTRRFVERMVSHRWDSIEETCFMDCAVTAEFEEPRTSFAGLWHLEGRTDVVGLVDGVTVTGLTVTNGVVELPSTVPTGTRVSFGIPYQVDVETLPVRVNAPGIGSNIGRRHEVGEVILSLQDTRSISAGIDEDHLYPVKQRTDEDYGSPDDLMNGESEPITMDNKARNTASVWIRQTLPLPFTLLGVGVSPIIHG
jgi:hypothetical protein